ncbi:MAG: low molecular weight phosphatase family protein [Candidatus Aminicenantes bacterium]|nr:low molecular weight phosphatase family protein [Candidatus Aminicenantes bacterium]
MKEPLRILFVCFGNICRSPMAVGIAKSLYGDRLHAESAGVGATPGTPPTSEAVLAVRTLFQADIAGHVARSFEAVDPAAFDLVIGLDFGIYTRLKRRGDIAEGRLYGWDIEDPLGLGYEAYKEAARKIQARLAGLAAARGFAP